MSITNLKNILNWNNLSGYTPVILVPGELFFTLRVEIPQGTSAGELLAFAEIKLEEFSPFNLDQLYWGFLYDELSNGIFIYATTFERLKPFLSLEIEDAYHVLPSFASICMQVWPEPTIVCLLQDKTLSALYFTSNDPLPTKVISARLEGENESALITQAFAKRDILIKRLLVQDAPSEEGVIICTKSEILSNGAIQFNLKHVPKLDSEGISLASPSIDRNNKRWFADLRLPELKKAEQKKRLINQRIWLGFLGSGGLALLIVFLQVLRLGFFGVESLLNRKINSQKQLVQKIEEDGALLDRINQFTNQQFEPFTMLGLMNVKRPATLLLESIKSEPLTGMEVRGSASSVDQVNQFVTALETSPFVENLDLSDIQTRRGRVSFILQAQFNLPRISPTVSLPKTSPATDVES